MRSKKQIYIPLAFEKERLKARLTTVKVYQLRSECKTVKDAT